MTNKKIVKKAIFIFLGITAISGLLIYLQNFIGLEKIRILIIEAGAWGPLIYILLHLITHIVAPIQGSPFLILAIAIFGKWAFVYTYFVAVLSSFTNFWISRKLGRDIVVKLAGHEGMQKIDKISEKEGIKALVVMRFFQGFISDFVSYAAGLTSIKFASYYLVSIIVPIPWTLFMFFFFELFPQDQVFFWTLLIGAIFFVAPPLYYFLRNRNSKKRPKIHPRSPEV